MAIDSNFKTVLGMCQMMLRQRASESSSFLTSDVIRHVVEEITALPTFSDVNKDHLIAELEERFTVYAPNHLTLIADDGHEAWLSQKLNLIRWQYWDRYLLFLQDRMPDASVKSLDKVTNDVLSQLEDPERSGMWDRRGLVMGHVQSGKTANYCGLICKAADAGYKVIIVLSGIHNNLRSQTQIRLDEGFLGFMSEPRTGGNQQTYRKVGVGLIDGSIHVNPGTNRTERGDFSAAFANQFGIHPGGLPLLFVIKKNATVLNNLLGWIRSFADMHDPEAERRFVRNVPALVVDDEADLASVDTRQQPFDELGNPDLEHNPTRINELIRRILRSFEKVAYVGYTATPFANIFIHNRGFTRILGDDLFPRSFIVNIPPQSNYLGPARIFGIRDEDDVGLEELDPLPIVRTINDHAQSDAIDEQEGWMPPKLVERTGHRPLYNGENCVPPSLRAAMMAFILATTVRKFREPGPHYNSMLVHVVRYTAVQQLVAEQVQIALRDILQRLQNGDGDRTPTIQDEFRDLWNKDFVPTNLDCHRILGERAAPSLPEWSAMVSSLREVTASIRVKTINGTAGDILDYQEHRATGMNVIAIGGDKLSRGLTLEGLSVSYFLRASRMYDTLMQMGRWFGYHEGYVDVSRLYTTRELLEWFTYIAAASEELQREFQHMVDVKGTPRDYGLKVRSHPVMLVTSQVKMRNGTEMKLSYSGERGETDFFHTDPSWIARNFSATENWLASLDGHVDGTKAGGYKWTDVRAPKVIEFFNAYSSHKDNSTADTALLAKYINNAQILNNELINWTVFLFSSGISKQLKVLCGLDVGLLQRSVFDPYKRPDRVGVRQLMSPADELIDLNKEQEKAAMQETLNNWEGRKRKPEDLLPKNPGRHEIRLCRPATQGLLLLYPLDPESLGLDASVKPVIGFGVSFPEARDRIESEITYIVNNIYTLLGGDDDGL